MNANIIPISGLWQKIYHAIRRKKSMSSLLYPDIGAQKTVRHKSVVKVELQVFWVAIYTRATSIYVAIVSIQTRNEFSNCQVASILFWLESLSGFS